MLEPEQHYIEVVIWKREQIGDTLRTWSNSYHFTSSVALTEGTAFELCHNLGTGEQFMYTAHVEIFGWLCWEWSAIERIAERSRVFIWPERKNGNKPRPESEQVLPFEYALLFKKQAELGRGSHLAYRRTVAYSEVVPYREDSYAIPHAKPFGYFESDLQVYWLNNVPLRHAIWHRSDELTAPTTSRPVRRIDLASLSKFQSVEDAQARKTFRAAPYRQAWEAALPVAFAAVARAKTLSKSHPDGMLKEELQELDVFSQELKGVFTYLLDYWTEGVKPVLMLNWRPTAGLDPLSLSVQRLVGDAVGAIEELADLMQDMYSYPGERVPEEAVIPWINAYTYYVLVLDRVGALRWTGTPIPVPSL